MTTRSRNQGPFLPGATLGILGSGQLGRMLTLAARRMGYRVAVFSPEADSPTGQIADIEVVAPYDDTAALEDFARQCDVVTLEFENIPVSAVQAVDAITPVHPGAAVLETTQNRLREKWFLSLQGLPVTPFAAVNNRAELDAAIEKLGLPAVLKTAGSGYDGKGQVLIRTLEEVAGAYASLDVQQAVLEQFVSLEREISVVAASNGTDPVVLYAPVENRHTRHILDVSIAPANIPKETGNMAQELARQVMTSLKMRGVLCVEFFITTDGALLINELAPRPHNSGHYSIEACPCSQFEQQLRAVCGLPLGSTQQLIPAAMGNLLGELWQGGEPDWQALLRQPLVYLHLYGKRQAEPGRKMGHVTALGSSPDEALERVERARESLKQKTRP